MSPAQQENPPKAPEDPVRAVLEEFVEAVEATGGVNRHDAITVAPCADESWTDLGDIYLKACEALGREPVIDEGEYEEDEEGKADEAE